MKYLVCGLLLLLAPIANAFTLDEWQAQQARTSAFLGHIEQSRWLAAQELRVHTNGRLMFVPDQSMIWQWLSPLRATLGIDAAGRFFHLAPKAQITFDPLATKDGLPGAQQVSRVLLAALHGDIGTLREDYYLLLDGDAEQWRLVLLPRQAGRDIAKLVTLRGGHRIDTLSASSSSGNALNIRLFERTPLVDEDAARHFQDSLATSSPAASGD
nr:hypothetical protein [uncultured Halomonas sp.]